MTTTSNNAPLPITTWDELNREFVHVRARIDHYLLDFDKTKPFTLNRVKYDGSYEIELTPNPFDLSMEDMLAKQTDCVTLQAHLTAINFLHQELVRLQDLTTHVNSKEPNLRWFHNLQTGEIWCSCRNETFHNPDVHEVQSTSQSFYRPPIYQPKRI